MNKRIKTKWLKALRSGEYQQGKDALREGDKFCCLGVLCDLHNKKYNHYWEYDQYLAEDVALPIEVIKWSGLEDCNPQVNSKFGDTLSQANDDGASFKQIANIIEKQL